MSEPHPLNQAVIAQALHDLRNGQLRRAKAMGFDDTDLEMLKRPAAVSMLANATVSWCSVIINRDALRCLFHQISDVDREIGEVDRLLRLGARTEIIGGFYGLTHQEVALRRNVIGLPKRKGRHRVLSDEESAELWRRCSALSGRRAPAGSTQSSSEPTMTEPAMNGLFSPAPNRDVRAMDGFLYSGNRYESFPRGLLLDRCLTPLERNAWLVLRLALNADGITAFPTYDQMAVYLTSMPCARRASHETVARALTMLRLTRWISLGRVHTIVKHRRSARNE